MESLKRKASSDVEQRSASILTSRQWRTEESCGPDPFLILPPHDATAPRRSTEVSKPRVSTHFRDLLPPCRGVTPARKKVIESQSNEVTMTLAMLTQELEVAAVVNPQVDHSTVPFYRTKKDRWSVGHRCFAFSANRGFLIRRHSKSTSSKWQDPLSRASRWLEGDANMVFYYAQLLHYGLPTTEFKEVAKWRLKSRTQVSTRALAALDTIKTKLFLCLSHNIEEMKSGELRVSPGRPSYTETKSAGPRPWMVEEPARSRCRTSPYELIMRAAQRNLGLSDICGTYVLLSDARRTTTELGELLISSECKCLSGRFRSGDQLYGLFRTNRIPTCASTDPVQCQVAVQHPDGVWQFDIVNQENGSATVEGLVFLGNGLIILDARCFSTRDGVSLSSPIFGVKTSQECEDVDALRDSWFAVHDSVCDCTTSAHRPDGDINPLLHSAWKPVQGNEQDTKWDEGYIGRVIDHLRLVGTSDGGETLGASAPEPTSD